MKEKYKPKADITKEAKEITKKRKKSMARGKGRGRKRRNKAAQETNTEGQEKKTA